MHQANLTEDEEDKIRRESQGNKAKGNGGDTSTGFSRSRGISTTLEPRAPAPSQQIPQCLRRALLLVVVLALEILSSPACAKASNFYASQSPTTRTAFSREDLPVSAESAFTRAGLSGNQPSGARTFIQRTMALFRRQSRQAPKRRLSPLLPRVRPDTSRPRDGSALLTRLVLPSTDDVSFSSSSFFRRVEEVSALNAARSEAPLVTSLPSAPLPLRPPPRPPRRRPPPPVDEASFDDAARSVFDTRFNQSSAGHAPKSAKTDLDPALELQALATTLDARDSPPLAQQRLRASPSIKSAARASLPAWSASQSAAPAPALGRDPLTELLAVSDELKAMRNFDSEDILYMSDVPPFPSLPPTLHAFLDAPGTSLHILEMEIHRESETFLGVPIPCIVVTSESDPLPPMDALVTPAVPLPQPPIPEVDMLAPPPTTYRARTDAENQSPALVDSDQELGSPPAPASPYYEDAEEGSPYSILGV
jgi:hypothetical protein